MTATIWWHHFWTGDLTYVGILLGMAWGIVLGNFVRGWIENGRKSHG